MMAIPLRRLRFTPLRDLARGRVTGRLDWRAVLDASGLPPPARELVAGVVRRTRLWRIEKVAVAEELVAHFADALAAGASVDAAVADFGDPRAAARLIRRAKRRLRPLAWHALKYATRAMLVLFAIYGVLIVRFVTARPTIRTDYLTPLNAPTERLPESQRAWPVYQQVLSDARLPLLPSADPAMRTPLTRQPPEDTYVHRLVDATPADTEWPQLGAWLDARAEPLAKIRAAAARPAMGFTYEHTTHWSNDRAGRIDARLSWDNLPRANAPDVNDLASIAGLLSRDFAWARDQRQGGRAVADLVARFDLAAQMRGGPLFVQESSIWTDRETLARLLETLRDAPATFGDAQLVALAHRVGRIGGAVAGTFFDLTAEAAIAHDRVQRIYTDDGHGDGRLARAAIRTGWARDEAARRNEERTAVLLGAIAATRSSRREADAAIDRAVADAQARLARPARDFRSLDDWRPKAGDNVEPGATAFGTALCVMRRWPELAEPNIDVTHMQARAEQLIAERDAAVVAIALELYHRRHGAYPPTLAALAPSMLPAVPVDRFDGAPLRYRVIDGKPIVYCAGVDRDDDGGREPMGSDGQPAPYLSAQWAASPRHVPDGDWVLFGGRPSAR